MSKLDPMVTEAAECQLNGDQKTFRQLRRKLGRRYTATRLHRMLRDERERLKAARAQPKAA